MFGTQNYESCSELSKVLVRSAIGHRPLGGLQLTKIDPGIARWRPSPPAVKAVRWLVGTRSAMVPLKKHEGVRFYLITPGRVPTSSAPARS